MTRHVHDQKCILRMEMGPGRRLENTATRTTGQAFLLHNCSLVSSFWRPFESTATVANMSVSLGIRSLVLYFSKASKDIQSVVTNYYRTN